MLRMILGMAPEKEKDEMVVQLPTFLENVKMQPWYKERIQQMNFICHKFENGKLPSDGVIMYCDGDKYREMFEEYE